MVFNGGDFKNGISFSFRIPPDPPKGAAVAACAAITAKIENTRVISNEVAPLTTGKITDLAENRICCTYDPYK